MKRSKFYQPMKRPYEWGYLIGVMCSDASKVRDWPRCRGFSMGVKDKEFTELLVQTVKRITGHQYSISSRLNRKTTLWCTSITHTHLSNIIDSLGCTGTEHWQVPTVVFWNEDIAKGFINGYFDGDGSVIPTEWMPYLSFSSINLDGLQQIQRLLANLGIGSSLNSSLGYHKLLVRRKCDVLTYWRVIGITLNRKKQRFIELLRLYIATVKYQHYRRVPLLKKELIEI